ncbi:Osmotin, thaumatin-like protein [Backusella circina FSU 941]|nr:Osmotin, thaumatin-like protein [Backusella circina FSU 941]
MVNFITLFSSIALAGMSVMAAPSSVVITVKNSCSSSIQVNQLTNDEAYGSSTMVAAGSSTKISVSSKWGGRIWARQGCSGSSDCQSGSPASLAEFLLNGGYNMDYYDISFVDGFNLPMTIAPNGGSGSGYLCGTPKCTTLPSCPSGLEDKDSNGKVIGCKSPCTAYGTSEYCCTDSERGSCGSSSYASAVQSACPEVYSYAFDDNTSMFSCSPTNGYTVTFC